MKRTSIQYNMHLASPTEINAKWLFVIVDAHSYRSYGLNIWYLQVGVQMQLIMFLSLWEVLRDQQTVNIL